MSLRLIAASLVLLVLASACGEGPLSPAARVRDVPHVYTTFYPTQYLAQRIGGDKARVQCLLPAGEDARLWRPDAAVVARYQQDADLIVVHAAGLDSWVEQRSLPPGRLCQALRDAQARLIRRPGPVKHTHGGREHVHEETDPHTWLDPTLLRSQAHVIHAELVSRYPRHADTYDANHAELDAELAALDAAFRALGELPKDEWIYTAHDTYAYPARAYGWRVVDLDLDPARVPSDEELAAIAQKVKYKPGRQLWWERAPTQSVADAVREQTGLESAVFSPCMSAPADGDLLGTMRANIERIRPAFAKP